jgi:hypothetical protein
MCGTVTDRNNSGQTVTIKDQATCGTVSEKGKVSYRTLTDRDIASCGTVTDRYTYRPVVQ